MKTQYCPACGKPLCRTDSRAPFEDSIEEMEIAMDEHLPTCGPSNTPAVNAAAQAVADTLRRM